MALNETTESFTRKVLQASVEEARRAVKLHQEALDQAIRALEWFDRTHPAKSQDCAPPVVESNPMDETTSSNDEPTLQVEPEITEKHSCDDPQSHTPKQPQILQLVDDLKRQHNGAKKRWTFTYEDLIKAAEVRGWDFTPKTFREAVNRISKKEIGFKFAQIGAGKRPTTFFPIM